MPFRACPRLLGPGKGFRFVREAPRPDNRERVLKHAIQCPQEQHAIIFSHRDNLRAKCYNASAVLIADTRDRSGE